jgi:hypothetical protein
MQQRHGGAPNSNLFPEDTEQQSEKFKRKWTREEYDVSVELLSLEQAFSNVQDETFFDHVGLEAGDCPARECRE